MFIYNNGTDPWAVNLITIMLFLFNNKKSGINLITDWLIYTYS